MARIGLVAAAAVVVIGAGLRAVGVWRPPRPMFSSVFAAGERDLVPRWQRVLPLQDTNGCQLYADATLNIVVLLRHTPIDFGGVAGIMARPARIGRNEAVFSVGKGWGTVRATERDRIVLIDERGVRAGAALPPGAAGQLYEHAYDVLLRSSDQRSVAACVRDVLGDHPGIAQLLELVER